ncbi:MAG TPA: hypothetical protein ENG35_03325 [Desulfobacteraceae bacterium]|nr:hypothetical protein [Desulfobacteraceae bacterium]
MSIIVNPQVVRGTVSRNSLQAIFGMRFHTWPDGIPIKVFVLPDNHPLHKKFCKDELNIFPHQLRWCWDRQVFSGTGQAPIEVSTPKEMLEKVASTPGAIGYSEWPPVDETLKILLIK